MIWTFSLLTFSKTGLLLLTSSTPTMTCAVEDRGWGPPEALSSTAVMLSTYSTPWRWGGGLERNRIKPADKWDRSVGSSGWTISRDTSVLRLCPSSSSRRDDLCTDQVKDQVWVTWLMWAAHIFVFLLFWKGKGMEMLHFALFKDAAFSFHGIVSVATGAVKAANMTFLSASNVPINIPDIPSVNREPFITQM